MSRTRLQLLQELAQQLGEYASFTASSGGTATTILTTSLKAHLPNALAQFNAWIYSIGPTNAAQTARASVWTPSSSTLTLVSPGFTASTVSGDAFELHLRTTRARKLAALDAAVGNLGLYWGRPVVDTTLTTAAGQYVYTLPAAQNWASVELIEIQNNPNDADAPYDDARIFNWVIREGVTTAGTETWVIQFGSQPTPGRVLRVYGTGHMGAMTLDADVLPTAGNWEHSALEYIYAYAKFRVLDEVADKQPTGSTERYRLRAMDKLQEQGARAISLMRPHKRGRIMTPWSGTGRLEGRPGVEWFGSTANTH